MRKKESIREGEYKKEGNRDNEILKWLQRINKLSFNPSKLLFETQKTERFYLQRNVSYVIIFFP